VNWYLHCDLNCYEFRLFRLELMLTFCCRQLFCEWSGMWDDMEHQRTTAVPRLDCWNIEQRSAADDLQVTVSCNQ